MRRGGSKRGAGPTYCPARHVWPAYEAMLALRGDASGVRMSTWTGRSSWWPDQDPRGRKKTLARLLETWALGRAST